MNKEEKDSLVASAMAAVEIHAKEKYGLPRDIPTDPKKRNFIDSTYNKIVYSPRHMDAMSVIPAVVSSLLESEQATLSTSSAVNKRAVSAFATQLYTQIQERDVENTLGIGVVEKPVVEAFAKALDAAKHPKPIAIGPKQVISHVIRLATEKLSGAGHQKS